MECQACSRVLKSQQGLSVHRRYCAGNAATIPRRLEPPVRVEEPLVDDIPPHMNVYLDNEGDSEEEEPGYYFDQDPGAPGDYPPPHDQLPNDLKYVHLQEELFQKSFSLESLQDSTDLESFIRGLPEYNTEDVIKARLLHFKRKAGLSKDSGNKLLALINSFNPEFVFPMTGVVSPGI